MFKLISFLSCLNINNQPVQEKVYLDFTMSSEYGWVTVQDYDAVYQKYSPLILKKYGPEIQAFITQMPDDERSQFIKRYVQVVSYKLSLVSVEHRDQVLPIVMGSTPSSEKEHNYIHDIKNDIPPRCAVIGAVRSNRHSEIENKIKSIQAQLLINK